MPVTAQPQPSVVVWTGVRIGSAGTWLGRQPNSLSGADRFQSVEYPSSSKDAACRIIEHSQEGLSTNLPKIVCRKQPSAWTSLTCYAIRSVMVPSDQPFEQDRRESLDFADRWLRDAIRSCEFPGGFVVIEADMRSSQQLLVRLQAQGLRVTYTHLFVRVAALALIRHRDLHQLVAGNRRLYPAHADICISIQGDAALAPVLVVRSADTKDLVTISEEIRAGISEARRKDDKLHSMLRKWGWVVGFGFIRRFLLRLLLNRLRIRREASGTFHVSCVPTMDIAVPFLFNTSAILGVGQVRERVVVENSQPRVRTTVNLTCCVDHKVWNGMQAERFLRAVKEILESGELEQEASTSRSPQVLTASAGEL